MPLSERGTFWKLSSDPSNSQSSNLDQLPSQTSANVPVRLNGTPTIQDMSPGGFCLPLSVTALEQHQHNLPLSQTPRQGWQTTFGTLPEDELSVSSLGGENINLFDFPGSPRSPLMTPQTVNRKSAENTSTSERLMLQDAFSSLSLADKCALSVSLNPNFVSSRKLVSASGSIGSWDSPGGRSSSPSLRDRDREPFPFHEEVLLEEPSSFFSHEALKNVPKLEVLTSFSYFGERGRVETGNRSNTVYGHMKIPSAAAAKAEELNLESMGMRSVISESDKESLDVAMSMMRQQELDQVEDEVRKIQNNVRGWLLRKNYVNLRDAAKTLQVAWRGKRRLASNSNSNGAVPTDKELIQTERSGQQDCAGLLASKQLNGVEVQSSTRNGVAVCDGDNGREEYGNECDRNGTVSMTTSPCQSPTLFLSNIERMPCAFASSDLSSIDTTANMGGTGEGKVCVSTVREPSNVHTHASSGHRSAAAAALSSTSSSLAAPPASIAQTSTPTSTITSSHVNADLRELNAAATSQTSECALPARKKSFAHAKRQAMASLVIQKSFLQWRVKREQTSEADKKNSDINRNSDCL